MAQYLDEITGTYVSADEYFEYQADHSTGNQAGLSDLASYIDLERDYDDLAEDAQTAFVRLYEALTELDYENGERYWLPIESGSAEELAILDKYLPRIFA
jgi:hypothetical protein